MACLVLPFLVTAVTVTDRRVHSKKEQLLCFCFFAGANNSFHTYPDRLNSKSGVNEKDRRFHYDAFPARNQCTCVLQQNVPAIFFQRSEK